VNQWIRLFSQPGTFFNQLQWSRHHWWILFSFLFVAAVETHVGRSQVLLTTYASVLSNYLQIGFDTAVWLAVSAKLFLLLAGAIAIAHVIYFIGSFFGDQGSRRVLFRRLAVVFTIILAAYTGSHLEHMYDWMGTASLFLYIWGGLLGFIALREQFMLSMTETLVVGSLASLLVFGSWTVSQRMTEQLAKDHMAEIAAKSSVTHTKRVR
jgi:hypothetical protein